MRLLDNLLIGVDEKVLHQRLVELFKSYNPKTTKTTISTFEDVTRVHDWRNHIPAEIGELWPALSRESRLVAAIMAQIAAENEEWE